VSNVLATRTEDYLGVNIRVHAVLDAGSDVCAVEIRSNVFLELGAGLALERPCIIICKHGTTVPADLQGLDRIEYRSYIDLTAQLKDKLNAYL